MKDQIVHFIIAMNETGMLGTVLACRLQFESYSFYSLDGTNPDCLGLELGDTWQTPYLPLDVVTSFTECFEVDVWLGVGYRVYIR